MNCSNIFTVLEDTLRRSLSGTAYLSFWHIRPGVQLIKENTYLQENFDRFRAGGSCSAAWNVLSDDSEGSLVHTMLTTVVLKQGNDIQC